MLLVVSDERCLAHSGGATHPERPDRLVAALDGVDTAGIDDALVRMTPRAVSLAELGSVHTGDLIDQVVALDAAGGGRLDADTAMNADSLAAASLAAGSVLTAVEELETSSTLTAAYCVVRPPGHHATADTAMGFCLFNSVAVAARRLADQGERVAIVDIDAHHGNGTQDIFYADPDVLYVSVHQSPLYPGSGRATERGAGAGLGTTLNVPLPPGATGDVVRDALDRLIVPALERHRTSWLFISAGYDGHRADPLTDLGYTSADIAAMTEVLTSTVGAGRVVALLEGGYDLGAIRDSSAAVAARLVGVHHRREEPTSGGPGREVVTALVDQLAAEH